MRSQPSFQNASPSQQPVTVSGTVVSGHRVASGQSATSPYPKGTIEMQTPHFQPLGVDLSPFYPGTLNVSIAPHAFDLTPKITLPQVKWSAHHEAESFSFVPITLTWQQQTHSGLIYYPRPETKINHFQDPSVLELLLPFIEGLTYGQRVAIVAPSDEFKLEEAEKYDAAR